MSETTSAVTEAVDIAANAPEAISNLFEYGGKIMYGAGYTVAFVIVFPVALLFAVIPKGNVLMQGVIEGSAAARSKAEGMVG